MLTNWCNSWDMKLNADKTKTVQVRNRSAPVTNYVFKCGGQVVITANKYKYLGLWVTEFLDYAYMAKEVAKSFQRALGLLIVKAKAYGGMPFKVLLTYTTP